MKFTYEIKTENTVILRPEGDLLGAPGELKLVELVDKELNENIKNCVLDASKIPYINSSGISLVIRLLTRFRNKGGDLVMVAPNDSVLKLLVITKLNKIFSIFDTEDYAMDILS